jgi:hypothetical protein
MHKNGGVKTAVFFVLWGGLALQMRHCRVPPANKNVDFPKIKY